MNIRITYNWLLDYLDTNADPYEIQKYLSLCGPSIERVEKVDDDYVFDIEITSNRVDSASVFGIALEAQAILPQFGKKAILRENPLKKYRFDLLPSNQAVAPLKINITDAVLCPRFTTIVLDVQVKDSPDLIKKRLQLCNIKSINNVIDISNYLMLSLGQPTHVFDYDKIEKQTMILRRSRKGEQIITLDKKLIVLPGDDIVIEDGARRLIDLCGIMGGLNSSVTEETKRVVLFVQNYDKTKIRRTSMLTGQRTVAATYFEKGLDSERVEPTLVFGVELLKKHADAKIASSLNDIYINRYQTKQVCISNEDIKKIIGVDIAKEKVVSILERLGFFVQVENPASLRYVIDVPSFRSADVDIKEDIVEEVARVYGYFNLPNTLQPCAYVEQPKETEQIFNYQSKIKHFLKNIGLHESLNYSMISEDLIAKLQLDKNKHLKLANTISEEIKYLRLSLIPSLIRNIKENFGKKDILKFFEIAKVYYLKKGDLPDEIYKLGIAVNTDFYDLKGIIEALLKELNIANYQVGQSNHHLLAPKMQAEIVINNQTAGFFGELKPEYKLTDSIKTDVFLAELDFQSLIEAAKTVPVYRPINPYAVIKLDLTVKIGPDLTFAKIKNIAQQTASLLQQIEVIDLYRNNLTLRFYFSSNKRNITEEEAKKELKMIEQKIKSSSS